MLRSTIDDRRPQTRETAENQGVFADSAASGDVDGHAEVTAARFEGVDAPSFQRANAGVQPVVGLRDLARLHSLHLHGPQTRVAGGGTPKRVPYNITRKSTAAAQCRKDIA